MIRIDFIGLATEPMDLRAGTETYPEPRTGGNPTGSVGFCVYRGWTVFPTAQVATTTLAIMPKLRGR